NRPPLRGSVPTLNSEHANKGAGQGSSFLATLGFEAESLRDSFSRSRCGWCFDRFLFRSDLDALKAIQRFICGVTVLLICLSLHAAQRDAEWQKVEDAMKKGLPQTAITNLQPIIESALKDKAYA